MEPQLVLRYSTFLFSGTATISIAISEGECPSLEESP